MRIPIIRRGNDPTPIAWWEWLFAPAVYGVILFLCALILLLSVPYGIVMVTYQSFRDRRFSRRMLEQGRFIPWDRLKPHLLSGEGTLVVEQAQKDSHRVWWTQDDVEREAPTPPPPEEQLDYLRFMPPHPFVSWCFQRYLNPDSGKASLTVAPYSYPGGFIEKAFFSERFPNLRVVMSVKLN